MQVVDAPESKPCLARDAIEALACQVGRLDLEERVILLLYFAVGMSRQEIARELSTPPLIIEHKLYTTVDWLRHVLVIAGHEDALALLNRQGFTALLDAVPVPQHFHEKLLHAVFRKSTANQQTQNTWRSRLNAIWSAS